MDNRVKVILCNSVIHIDIGKQRNSDDEDAYEKRLRSFAKDRLYDSIVMALNNRDYFMAEQFSNRLLIKSYNLGMVRLANRCDELRIAMLNGKGSPLFSDEISNVTAVYRSMRDCINRAFK